MSSDYSLRKQKLILALSCLEHTLTPSLVDGSSLGPSPDKEHKIIVLTLNLPHTHMHARAHTHTHACTRAHTHTCMHARAHTHTHTHTHNCSPCATSVCRQEIPKQKRRNFHVLLVSHSLLCLPHMLSPLSQTSILHLSTVLLQTGQRKHWSSCSERIWMSCVPATNSISIRPSVPELWHKNITTPSVEQNATQSTQLTCRTGVPDNWQLRLDLLIVRYHYGIQSTVTCMAMHN